jgi:Aerotolerance regulator N-terminal/von Willebrand factor type A domain
MGFLAPWFLAGVAAIGLPIWIHLLKRHRTDPRLFPSLMLFEKREQSSVKHRRLEYLLLFALRALMILLLALLFANPFIRRTVSAKDSKKLMVIAVDRSFSMRAANHLQLAKEEALSALSKLPAGDQAQVVALGAQVQALTQPNSDVGALRAAINSIEPSDSRASFGEIVRYTRTLSESTKMPIELHLVSDLQKSALPGFADVRFDPNTTLVLHPIGKVEPNWTVENVVAPRRVYDPKKVRVVATVAGFGAPAAKKTVSLLVNGKVQQTKSVDVPAGTPGRATVEFLGLDAPYGFSRGEVTIDGGDILPADDRFPFSVERTDPRKVLFVDDGHKPLGLVYFRAALDASADAAFQLESMHPEMAGNQQLSNYAMVVLNDPGTLPPGLEDSLKRYVSGGGGLLISLGPSAAALPKVPVLDDPIESSSYAGRERDRFLSVTEIDTGHPALRNVERFNGVEFLQAIRVTPGKSHVLARLNDQTPLVLERQIGEGKVLVFASTFDYLGNDLPKHAAWVPFIQQSTAYLGGGGPEQPVNLTVDSYVELRSGTNNGSAAEVLGPDGKRLLSLEEAAKATNFQVASEGFFEVKTASGRHSLIAVHADRRESDLTPIPQETLDLWKATGEGDQSTGGASGLENQDVRKPWGLWPYLLLLLLLIAVAESVVANGYLRPPAEEQPGKRKEAA